MENFGLLLRARGCGFVGEEATDGRVAVAAAKPLLPLKAHFVVEEPAHVCVDGGVPQRHELSGTCCGDHCELTTSRGHVFR